MKRHTWFGLVFTLCIAIGIGIAGCDTTTDSGTQDLIDPTEVGELHNEALDFMLADLKESGDEAIALGDMHERKTTLLAKMEKSCNRYLDVKEHESMFRGCDLGFNALRKAEKSGVSLGMVYARTGSYLEYFAHNSALDERQEYYLSQIFQVLHSSDGNDLSPGLDEIVDQAIDELGEDDAAVVVISSSVAKASHEYWKENLDEWVHALSDYAGVDADSLIELNTDANISANMIQPYCVFIDCTKMAGADVAGAAAGAAGGLITGAGVGVAALGGAAAGSVGSAVQQVWDFFS